MSALFSIFMFFVLVYIVPATILGKTVNSDEVIARVLSFVGGLIIFYVIFALGTIIGGIVAAFASSDFRSAFESGPIWGIFEGRSITWYIANNWGFWWAIGLAPYTGLVDIGLFFLSMVFNFIFYVHSIFYAIVQLWAFLVALEYASPLMGYAFKGESQTFGGGPRRDPNSKVGTKSKRDPYADDGKYFEYKGESWRD